MITEEQITEWYSEWLDIDIEPTSLAPSSVFYITNKAAEFEREECAKLCVDIANNKDYVDSFIGAEICADAIRKRGEK